jgi:hypothetical protein
MHIELNHGHTLDYLTNYVKWLTRVEAERCEKTPYPLISLNWMFDQARLRGENVLLWPAPFVPALLPTRILFILFLQRK